MIKHETPRWPVGDGLPWFEVKVGSESYHLRLPGRALGDAIVRSYVKVSTEHHALVERTKAIQERLATGDASADDVSEALAAVDSVQDAVRGMLGSIVLACWHDPCIDLHTVKAWALQSAYMRRRFRQASYQADDQTEDIQAMANALSKDLGVDIRGAYGLMVADELRDELGWTFRTFDDVATKCAGLLMKEHAPGLADADVEVVADFSPALTANAP